MPEEERLTLDVEVQASDAIAELEALEQQLERVDDEIRQIGRDTDAARIDIEVDKDRAVGGIEAIDEAWMDLQRDLDEGVLDNLDDDLARRFRKGRGALEDAIAGDMDIDGFDDEVDVNIDGPDVGASAAGATGRAAASGGGLAGRVFGGNRDEDTISGRVTNDLKQLAFNTRRFNAVIAGVVPLLVVFLGTLPAVIGGLVALGGAALGAAGALGAIAGLGAMALPIRDRLADLQSAFADAFEPLAQTLAPVLDTAITQFETMAGTLAAASSGLLQFRDVFLGFSSFLSRAIPSFVGDLLAFTDALMPILGDLGSFLANLDLFEAFGDILSTALPPLINMGQALMDIVPLVVSLSQGFLVVASVITMVVGAVARAINVVGPLGQILGVLTASFVTLVAAVSLATLATSGATAAAARLVVVYAQGLVNALIAAHFWLSAYIGQMASAITITLGLVAAVGLLTAGLSLLAGGFSLGLFSNSPAVQNARSNLDAVNGGRGFGNGGGTIGGDTVIYAGNRDDAARQQFASSYERRQHVDSVFGG